MRRLMNLVILVALSLILVVVWSNKLRGGIEEMQVWSHGSSTIALSSDGKLLAARAGPLQERQVEGRRIASSSTIKLHSFPDGEVVRTLEAFYVTKLAFSPDNSLIAAGTGGGDIFVWRVESGQLLYQRKASFIIPSRPDIHTVIFSRDGQTLVTMIGGLIDVWRVESGELRYSIQHGEYDCFGDLSPDGKTLALITPGKKAITFINLEDGTYIGEIPSYGLPKFSPDGQNIAYPRFEDGQKVISLYRLSDNAIVETLVVGKKVSVEDFVFSPDGRYVAAIYKTGGTIGGVLVIPDSVSPEVWHLAVCKLSDEPSKKVYPMTIQSKEKAFTAVAFSPDSKILVTGGDKIRLWRVP